MDRGFELGLVDEVADRMRVHETRSMKLFRLTSLLYAS